MFYTHPCICVEGLLSPHAVESTSFSLPFSSINLLFSETKNQRKWLWKKCKLMTESKKLRCPTNCSSMTKEWAFYLWKSQIDEYTIYILLKAEAWHLLLLSSCCATSSSCHSPHNYYLLFIPAFFTIYIYIYIYIYRLLTLHIHLCQF